MTLDEMKDNLAEQIFGRSRSEALRQRICVQCGEDAKEFHDPLSEKEYRISGMCQKCQDAFFG